MDFDTIKKLKNCCAREAAMREKVYPRFIASGKMTKEKADEEIHLMKLAAACFNKILSGNAPEVQQMLFNTQDYQKRNYNYL